MVVENRMLLIALINLIIVDPAVIAWLYSSVG